jgi:hypothetical protein
MDREPKLPTPQIEPEKVADAILHAATHGGRDVRVGAMAVLNTAMAKVMPSVADKMSAKQAERQLEDEPPQHDPQGALYRPSNDGRIHGSDGMTRH